MNAGPSPFTARRTGIAFTLMPGDVRCASRGDRLATLLGSCIAIVLTDPRRTVGAMCHIVHAGRARAGVLRATEFAADALDAMFRDLQDRGIVPRLCEAFVYGGANMFPQRYTALHVGATNAAFVLQRLAAEGIPVRTMDVGGHRYRKLAWTIGEAAPEVVLSSIEPADADNASRMH